MAQEPDYGVPTGVVPRNFDRTMLEMAARTPGMVWRECMEGPEPPPGTPKPTIEVFKKVSPADETQVGGEHYKKYPVQPWSYIAANNLGYFEGSVISYVTRWRDKGGVADLEKARHFLAKLIELQG